VQIGRERFDARFKQSGLLRLENVAIAQEDGPLTFNENESVSVWGTTSPLPVERDERWRGTKSVATIVQGRRFENVLREHGLPYYTACRTTRRAVLHEGRHRGRRSAVRRGVARATEKPKYVSIESDMASWGLHRQRIQIAARSRLPLFKVVHQLEVPQQTPPNPAREGQYVDHSFPAGASGLFGDEAPGECFPRGRRCGHTRRIFIENRVFGNDGFFPRSTGSGR